MERRGARKGRDNDNRHLQVLNARSESEFEQIFVTVEQQRIGAMVVTSDTMVSNESATLGRVPTTKVPQS